MSREVRFSWKLLSQKILNGKLVRISEVIIRNGDPFSKVIRGIFTGALSAQTLIHSGDMDNNLYLSQYYCTDLRLGCSLFRALCIKDSCTFHNVNYGPVFVCPLIMAWLG